MIHASRKLRDGLSTAGVSRERRGRLRESSKERSGAWAIRLACFLSTRYLRYESSVRGRQDILTGRTSPIGRPRRSLAPQEIARPSVRKIGDVLFEIAAVAIKAPGARVERNVVGSLAVIGA